MMKMLERRVRVYGVKISAFHYSAVASPLKRESFPSGSERPATCRFGRKPKDRSVEMPMTSCFRHRRNRLNWCGSALQNDSRGHAVPRQRYSGLNKTKSYPTRNSAARLQRTARERADDEARRIPWQRLLKARNQYIDWQEFYLWVRSILEVENRIPDWLYLRSDKGPEFVAERLRKWLSAVGAKSCTSSPAVPGRTATVKASTASCETSA
jgi:hypothetical protein